MSRIQHTGQAAKFRHQVLGQRLHILHRDDQKQNQLKQFIIRQRFRSALNKPLPQTIAVSVVVWFGFFSRVRHYR